MVDKSKRDEKVFSRAEVERLVNSIFTDMRSDIVSIEQVMRNNPMKSIGKISGNVSSVLSRMKEKYVMTEYFKK